MLLPQQRRPQVQPQAEFRPRQPIRGPAKLQRTQGGPQGRRSPGSASWRSGSSNPLLKRDYLSDRNHVTSRTNAATELESLLLCKGLQSVVAAVAIIIDKLQIFRAVVPCFIRLRRVLIASGVNINRDRLAIDNEDSTTVGSPTRNVCREVLVRIGDAPIMLLLERVFGSTGSRV